MLWQKEARGAAGGMDRNRLLPDAAKTSAEHAHGSQRPSQPVTALCQGSIRAPEAGGSMARISPMAPVAESDAECPVSSSPLDSDRPSISSIDRQTRSAARATLVAPHGNFEATDCGGDQRQQGNHRVGKEAKQVVLLPQNIVPFQSPFASWGSAGVDGVANTTTTEKQADLAQPRTGKLAEAGCSSRCLAAQTCTKS